MQRHTRLSIQLLPTVPSPPLNPPPLSRSYSQQDERTQSQAGLRTDDRTLISGAISFSNKTVSDVQTKIDDIFMLHIDTRLTFDEIARIYLKGRSRVPVYEGDSSTPPQVHTPFRPTSD
jgi:CBS domain containing-hemolysin-like protein